MECCNMKGFLTYLILWSLNKGEKNGAELAQDLKVRKGSKPSPGTIYPALKELKKKGLISADKGKRYLLTPKGRKELENACAAFHRMFFDAHEMFGCCGAKGAGKANQ